MEEKGEEEIREEEDREGKHVAKEKEKDQFAEEKAGRKNPHVVVVVAAVASAFRFFIFFFVSSPPPPPPPPPLHFPLSLLPVSLPFLLV